MKITTGLPQPFSKHAVSDRVREIWPHISTASRTKSELHEQLQIAVCDLASEFGLTGGLEGRIAAVGGVGNKFIDVVWLDRGTRVAEFAIDSSPRKKSVRKLAQVIVPHWFWICYCKDPRKAEQAIREHGTNTDITPIAFPRPTHLARAHEPHRPNKASHERMWGIRRFGWGREAEWRRTPAHLLIQHQPQQRS
ncbi:hypothetical protein ACXR0O_24995 [Verrucomicrobiota bacterium sgz303538]